MEKNQLNNVYFQQFLKKKKTIDWAYLNFFQTVTRNRHIFLGKGKGGSTALKRSATKATGSLNLVYERATSPYPICPVQDEHCK